MWFTRVSIANPVMATMVMLAFVVLGLFSLQRLKVDQFPDVEFPVVVVQVDYPGASASVVETRITQTLEDALAGIEGINTIDSSSQNGASRISIEFYATRDIEAAAKIIAGTARSMGITVVDA